MITMCMSKAWSNASQQCPAHPEVLTEYSQSRATVRSENESLAMSAHKFLGTAADESLRYIGGETYTRDRLRRRSFLCCRGISARESHLVLVLWQPRRHRGHMSSRWMFVRQLERFKGGLRGFRWLMALQPSEVTLPPVSPGAGSGSATALRPRVVFLS